MTVYFFENTKDFNNVLALLGTTVSKLLDDEKANKEIGRAHV